MDSRPRRERRQPPRFDPEREGQGDKHRRQLADAIQEFVEALPSSEKAALSLCGVISNGHPQARISTGGRAPGDNVNHTALGLQKFRRFLEEEGFDVEAVLQVRQPSYTAVGRVPGGTRTDFRYKEIWVTMQSRLSPQNEAYLRGMGELEECDR